MEEGYDSISSSTEAPLSPILIHSTQTQCFSATEEFGTFQDLSNLDSLLPETQIDNSFSLKSSFRSERNPNMQRKISTKNSEDKTIRKILCLSKLNDSLLQYPFKREELVRVAIRWGINIAKKNLKSELIKMISTAVVNIDNNKTSSHGKYVDKKIKEDINRLKATIPNLSLPNNNALEQKRKHDSMTNISTIMTSKRLCQQDQQSKPSISEWVYTPATPIIQETSQIFYPPFFDDKNWIKTNATERTSPIDKTVAVEMDFEEDNSRWIPCSSTDLAALHKSTSSFYRHALQSIAIKLGLDGDQSTPLTSTSSSSCSAGRVTGTASELLEELFDCHQAVTMVRFDSLKLGLEFAEKSASAGMAIQRVLPSAASIAAEVLMPGDLLVSIQLQSTRQMSPQQQLQLLRSTPRPVFLGFVRTRSSQ